MNRDNWIVTQNSTRPNGEPDRCFYCGRMIGEEHKTDCVIRSKTVVVDFTFKTVLAVPEYWNEEQINYHYNDGTWCADNILYDLLERASDVDCSCRICETKYVKDANREDEERYGVTFIDKEES